jgi:hypothetical protein
MASNSLLSIKLRLEPFSLKITFKSPVVTPVKYIAVYGIITTSGDISVDHCAWQHLFSSSTGFPAGKPVLFT